jgi:hypothetical protein
LRDAAAPTAMAATSASALTPRMILVRFCMMVSPGLL